MTSGLERPWKKACLAHSLIHTSAEVVFKLQRLASGQEAYSLPRPSGAFQRKVRQILEPPKNCFVPLSIDSAEGESIHFWAADLDKLMSFVIEKAPNYKAALLSSPSTSLSFIWYADETTGGNVLATSQNKKCMLVYMAVHELKHLNSSCAWLPFSAIPHKDIQLLPGGFSEYCVALARHFFQCQAKGLQLAGRHYTVSLKAWLGDYEAVSGLLGGKGAAGLKPCCLCMNCVCKGSDVVHHNDLFKDITCMKIEEFQPYNQMELNQAHDYLMTSNSALSVARRDEVERQFGFRLQKNTVLATPVARDLFRLDRCILDSMHIYFSNGIASQELILIQQALLRNHGTTLADLKKAVAQVSWQCASPKYRSPSAQKWLFHESFWAGTVYKGDASAVWFLLSLLCFYASSLATYEDLPELKSFHALMEVVNILKQFRRGNGCPDALRSKQRRHLQCFLDMYTEEAIRPKHHLSLHLSKCYEYIYCDCWAGERKHQQFKRQLVNDLQSLLQKNNGQFSQAVLTRLLHRNVEQFHLWKPQLAGTLYEAEEVRNACGLECRMGTTYKEGSVELSKDDVLFFGRDSAGLALFFLEREERFFAFIEQLVEESAAVFNTRAFKRTPQIEAVPIGCSNVWRPAWWCHEDDKVVCLL